MSEGALPYPPDGVNPTPAGSVASGEEIPPLDVTRRLLFSTASFGSGMFNAFFNSALPLFIGRYDLPNWAVGLLAQERSILGSFLEPIVGATSDHTRTRFGRRRPFFLIGAPLAAFFLVVLSWTPATPVLVGALVFLPFFLAISSVPHRAMMADITPPRQRGGVGGTMSVLEMLGQVGLLVLSGAIWTSNPTLVFITIALALVAGFGVTFFSVKEPPLPPPTGRVQLDNPIGYLRRVLEFREAAKFVAALTFFWLGAGGVSPFLTRYAVYELGFSEGMAFNLFLALVIATAVCAVPAGILGDRLGKKKVMLAGLFVFGAAAIAGSRVSALEHLFIVLAIAGIANGATTALAVPLLTELLPKRRMGELIGMGGMLWSMSQPIGSLLAGLLADYTGGYRAVLFMGGTYMLIAGAITLFVRPSRAPLARGE